MTEALCQYLHDVTCECGESDCTSGGNRLTSAVALPHPLLQFSTNTTPDDLGIVRVVVIIAKDWCCDF